MIKKILLKFGPNGLAEKFEIDPGSVTIFVGPNNSGKSMVLKEIETYCQSGTKGNFKIIDDISIDIPEENQLRTKLEEMNVPFLTSEIQQPGHSKYGRFNSTRGFIIKTLNLTDFISWAKIPNYKQHFIQYYVSMFVSRFGGKERFQLVQNKDNGDLKTHPTNSLIGLLQSDSKRREVRALIQEAFGKYFVIDPTSMRSLEVRLSDTPPPSDEVERGWGDQSVQFHKAAKHINEFSDGVQAFTGLVMTVVAGEETIMLVDEPEAFLHPSLANLLGNKLSTLMSNRSGNLFVATHSPFFVMGCLQAGKKLNVIRLTYDEFASPTARMLSPEKVIELFKNPLLRSTGVIQALFHSTVIVGESDADRAFYNEINERLLAQQTPEGLPSALFLNAQNKQTVWDVLKPLRDMGIPTVGIVDIDFVKNGGSEFTKALNSARVPTTLHESLQGMRSKVKSAFEATCKDMKRDGGVAILQGETRALADKLIGDLAEYGIFLVPGGELESWLKHLDCRGHGPGWLIQVFGKMGSDPSDAEYVRPEEGDVWDFIRKIAEWVKNPDRKGTGNENASTDEME